MPDDKGLRRLVEEALPETLQPVGARLRWSFGGLTGYGQVIADALLPVVERHAARRAAEALREAATALSQPAEVAWLHARADALAADGAEPHPAHRHDETEAGRG